IIVDLKSCHQTIRSRDSRCHMLPDLLSTLLILVEMWLVSVVIRPEDLLSWLHNVSVGNTDVVQYGATSDDLRRKAGLLSIPPTMQDDTAHNGNIPQPALCSLSCLSVTPIYEPSQTDSWGCRTEYSPLAAAELRTEVLNVVLPRTPEEQRNVFVLDFPPCLNFDVALQDLLRQEFHHVAARMETGEDDRGCNGAEDFSQDITTCQKSLQKRL
ncbi:hypothetical protein AAFF_G00109110, partial [Aldrovandia affinis]